MKEGNALGDEERLFGSLYGRKPETVSAWRRRVLLPKPERGEKDKTSVK